ncbi:cyclase family protein [Dactylosporangium sucinum]|uniref:Cyclase n=1 Tax=Dactylosporangium sucinum TaxID=1424081 RepID=A0A917WZW6_9ACTN|nr:cyclase family protein [Dactylosporangium sucinum]GGM45818.1 cyclase [Dactylosporangium sucinum]
MTTESALSLDPVWERLGRGRVIDLAQPMHQGMPQSANHPPFRMVVERRHGDMVRPDGGSAANELIVTGGHVGTHVDALGHVSQDGRVHGGMAAEAIQSNRGLAQLGIDAFEPFVGRGVLLDVARLHGIPVLPAGYEITPEDLEAAAALAKVELRPTDAVLVGTGWSRLWPDHERFIGRAGGVPGPGEAAARWLVDRGVRVVGGETIAFERLAPGAGHATLPVHRVLLVESGVNIIETMRLHELLDTQVAEFLFVLAPLSIVGATGSPVRPLAVIGE